MKWKTASTLALLSAVSLIGSACSGGSGSGSGDSEEVKDASAKESKDPVELVFYSMSRDSEASFNERYGDAIRKKFPNYTIKYIQRAQGSDLPDLINAGTRIDIHWDSIGSFPSSNMVYELSYDMSDLIKKHKVDLSRFEPSLIDAMKQLGNGAIYGLPVYNERMALFYNKDLFDKLNVPYPQDGMTWTELDELAKKLNVEKDGVLYTGFSPSVNHLFLTNQYSLPLLDKSAMRPTITNEKWKQVLELQLLQPTQNPVYQKAMQANKGKILDLNQFAKDQSLAMFISSPLMPLVMKEELSKFNWDLVSEPTMPDAPGVGPQSYPGYFAITKMAKDKDAAMEVIKYLTSDEYQMECAKKGIMTSLKSEEIQKALGQESAFKGKNFGAFFYNKFPAIADKTVEESQVPILATYTKNLNKLSAGEMDINTMMRTADEEASKLLDGLKKK
ncbi:Bacterial extracellular solute-binding protein [Paenibacillus konkukensis]|uniref:Bacterial extracellular solute-binding protein n=1 Tax=Paenibacillus konkukensis TaxID=2020716 RepID=A0ABY4RK29_9BACL|nr:extracellular solute-binding protein [Paenibacillus konkukensis]UQZ82577.1 Bacterial extracellular solute-binding protein [Paenibacillus konkukensis]